MEFTYPTFQVQSSESLEPNDQKAGEIFSRLGYKISGAIADLVDNSIDAKASNVLVRFVRSANGIHRVLIVDNGHGMDDETLREAMRFGSDVNTSEKRLGKYGVGLKTASLSQAQDVTVLSHTGRAYVGRRWTLQNIKKNWLCEVLAEPGVHDAFRVPYGHVKMVRSGTIVIWENLQHLRTLPLNVDKVLNKTIDELCVELGIRFHRFLERDQLKIGIDQHFIGDDAPEACRFVTPLNPFNYPKSGHDDYPVTFKMDVDGTKVEAICHIWPSKSRAPGYRLGGGKVALRQGFYFYRNDRVIQAGGWNGWKPDDGEPHLSLARVEVNLPPALDSVFKLDVTKNHIDPSPQFLHALEQARLKDIDFAGYIDQAQAVYRKQKTKERAKFPFVPGSGIAVRARKAIAEILNEKGTGRRGVVRFDWQRLDHDEVVRVSDDRTTIILNSSYKKELAEGGKRDAPVLKLTLMFLLQSELEKAFVTRKGASWLQRVNLALLTSLKGK